MDGDFDDDRSQLFFEVESYAMCKIFWFDWGVGGHIRVFAFVKLIGFECWYVCGVGVRGIVEYFLYFFAGDNGGGMLGGLTWVYWVKQLTLRELSMSLCF